MDPCAEHFVPGFVTARFGEGRQPKEGHGHDLFRVRHWQSARALRRQGDTDARKKDSRRDSRLDATSPAGVFRRTEVDA